MDIQEIIAKIKAGEEVTLDELLYLARSYEALREKHKALDARIEALEREHEELLRALEVQRTINKMLSTIVRATRGIFSKN